MSSLHHLRLGALIAAGLWLAAGLGQPARAETIAIIGTGNVASALGPAFAKAGHRIVYGSRNPDRDSVRDLVARTGPDASAVAQSAAARGADVVILAVPGSVAVDVARNLGDLSGKVVIDPTNPRRVASDGLLDYAFDGSNAERIQNAVPGAHVVKAFNTMTAATMIHSEATGGPVSVPLAGDDAGAKAIVARLAEDLGLQPLDLGPVRYAHVIEGMFLVWANARRAGNAFEYDLRRD